MAALVVVESYFGNTRRIAQAVAAELEAHDIRVEVVDVGDAPARLAPDMDLLVVGGPTHDLGMSTPQSRATARARLGSTAALDGIREWIAATSTPARPPLVALFDTRTGYPWLAGSAAAQASVALSRRGFRVLGDRATFRVRDVEGPLQPGEEEHARHWARGLAGQVERRRLSPAR